MKPRLLDLYCGQGGAAVGYTMAGFEVTGVDCEPMPRYPFEFVQADALEYLAEHWQEYDAFHASPVCKGYSVMNNLPWLRDKEYPLQILPTREALTAIGKPYVIENVMGARWGAKGLVKRGLEAHGMKAQWLCGGMFGLPFYRHRLFETNFLWLAPAHPKHQRIIKEGRMLQNHAAVPVFSEAEDSRGLASWPNRRGNEAGSGLTLWQNGPQVEGVAVDQAKGWRLAAEAMGVTWMNRDGTTQAIPPVMTEHIGQCLKTYLRDAEAEARRILQRRTRA